MAGTQPRLVSGTEKGQCKQASPEPISPQREWLPDIAVAQYPKEWRTRSIHGTLSVRNIRLWDKIHLSCITFRLFVCFFKDRLFESVELLGIGLDPAP